MLPSIAKVGTWKGVLVALIPKPTGGERPIGPYLAVFRVWSAARVQALRDCERVSAQCRAFITGGGQATTDGVWRCTLRPLAPRCCPSLAQFLPLLGPRRALLSRHARVRSTVRAQKRNDILMGGLPGSNWQSSLG